MIEESYSRWHLKLKIAALRRMKECIKIFRWVSDMGNCNKLQKQLMLRQRVFILKLTCEEITEIKHKIVYCFKNKSFFTMPLSSYLNFKFVSYYVECRLRHICRTMILSYNKFLK